MTILTGFVDMEQAPQQCSLQSSVTHVLQLIIHHMLIVYTRERGEGGIRYGSIKEISPNANQFLALPFSTEGLHIPCIYRFPELPTKK